MAISVNYTNILKERYPAASQPSLVTVYTGRCAARVILRAVPGDPSGSVYAEIPAAMEGRVTSFAMRLLSGVPAGEALLTTVSPLIDITGSYLYAFLDGITPTSLGPPMYRKTNIRSAFYCTDKMDTVGKIFVLIPVGTALDGVEADVALWMDVH